MSSDSHQRVLRIDTTQHQPLIAFSVNLYIRSLDMIEYNGQAFVPSITRYLLHLWDTYSFGSYIYVGVHELLVAVQTY